MKEDVPMDALSSKESKPLPPSGPRFDEGQFYFAIQGLRPQVTGLEFKDDSVIVHLRHGQDIIERFEPNGKRSEMYLRIWNRVSEAMAAYLKSNL